MYYVMYSWWYDEYYVCCSWDNWFYEGFFYLEDAYEFADYLNDEDDNLDYYFD